LVKEEKERKEKREKEETDPSERLQSPQDHHTLYAKLIANDNDSQMGNF